MSLASPTPGSETQSRPDTKLIAHSRPAFRQRCQHSRAGPARPLVAPMHYRRDYLVIPGRLTSFKPSALHSCRVEEGRGFRLRQSRFPSPLIERSMRISRTTLSDWFHRGHTTPAHMSVYHASVLLPLPTPLPPTLPPFILSLP